MTSKIIQKEKERQDVYIWKLKSAIAKGLTGEIYPKEHMKVHKQSLINLKWYMEELVEKLNSMGGCSNSDWAWKIESEDIEELTKMIERYNGK